MYVIIKVHIILCNKNNFFFAHRKIKLFSKIETKCNTSIHVVPRYQIICFLRTFEQVNSATVQDKTLKLSENYVFSYKIND